jgi:hypothetical protein
VPGVRRRRGNSACLDRALLGANSGNSERKSGQLRATQIASERRVRLRRTRWFKLWSRCPCLARRPQRFGAPHRGTPAIAPSVGGGTIHAARHRSRQLRNGCGLSRSSDAEWTSAKHGTEPNWSEIGVEPRNEEAGCCADLNEPRQVEGCPLLSMLGRLGDGESRLARDRWGARCCQALFGERLAERKSSRRRHQCRIASTCSTL